MVGVAQLVSAPDCGSGDRGFESHLPPLQHETPALKTVLGYRQGVRHSTLTAAFGGPNPPSPDCGILAQVVEHLTFNQVVRGSSPRYLTGKGRRSERIYGLFYVSGNLFPRQGNFSYCMVLNNRIYCSCLKMLAERTGSSSSDHRTRGDGSDSSE